MRRLLPATALVAILLGGGSGLPVLPRELPESGRAATLPNQAPAHGSGPWATPAAVAPTPPLTGSTPPPTAPIPTAGPAFHVETAGDDAAKGTATAPWRTLAWAVAHVPDGATIRLGPGKFAATTIRRADITVAGSGDLTVISGGLVIRADGVTITGVTLTGQAGRYRGGVMVDGARNATISGNVIRGNPFGVHLVDAHAARIQDNLITDNGYGVEIHGATDGTLIADNEIVDNDRRLDASRAAGGVNLYFTTGGITLAGNRIEGNDEVAIEIYGASDLSIVRNRLSGSNDLIETGTERGRPCRNISITGNVLYSQDPTDASEERGIYLRCATNATVEWNTFVGLDRFAIGLFDGAGGFNGPLDGVSIGHNIIAGGRAFSIDSRIPSGVSIDNDVIYPCRDATCPILGREVAFVAGWRAGTDRWGTFRAWTGLEAKGRFEDPAFVDAPAHDFRLRAGSPAASFAGAFDAPER